MIFDRMTQYGPRQDFGARHQQVFDREAMAGMGGGMGRAHNPNGGINPGGMYTGGNMRPQAGLPPMGGPGQVFQTPQQNPWMTGGPGQQFQVPQFQTGGGLPPMQSGLGQWFNNYRRSAFG